MVLFEMEDGEAPAAASPPADTAVHVAVDNDAEPGEAAICGDLDPGLFAPPMMLMAPPHGIWRTASGMRIEEVPKVRIVADPDREQRSSSRVSMFRYSANRLVPVMLEWSPPHGRVVDDSRWQQDALSITPELLVLVQPLAENEAERF